MNIEYSSRDGKPDRVESKGQTQGMVPLNSALEHVAVQAAALPGQEQPWFNTLTHNTLGSQPRYKDMLN